MTQSQSATPDNMDVQALLEMARALASTSDLDSLLRMVIEYSMSLLGAERATLFLYDEQTEELYTKIAEGTSEFRMPVKAGIAGAAALSREIVNVPDAYADERFNRSVDGRTGWRTRNILACPLIDYEDRLVGVLQVLNKRAGAFDARDIGLAEALSAQAGVALQRAHLLEEYLEKQKLEHALELAREVQQRLFPQEAPSLAGFDIACWNRPCDATGGDCCDFLRLDDDRLVLTLGDVSGHGVGPALVSCATRAMLRTMASVNDDVEDVVRRVNTLLAGDLANNKFVTVFVGLLDGAKGELSYCSAGQGPLLWLHNRTDEVEVLGADGIPMGIMAGFDYPLAPTVKMEPGDLFVLLTDGFYEWAQQSGELFGVERAIEVIKHNKERSADEILVEIRDVVEAFADTPQGDDLTAIIVKSSK